MPTKTLPIINIKGLHARASAKFVEVVEGFDADAEVSRDGLSTSGDSIACRCPVDRLCSRILYDEFWPLYSSRSCLFRMGLAFCFTAKVFRYFREFSRLSSTSLKATHSFFSIFLRMSSLR